MYNTAIWTTIELQTLKVPINTCNRPINTNQDSYTSARENRNPGPAQTSLLMKYLWLHTFHKTGSEGGFQMSLHTVFDGML